MGKVREVREKLEQYVAPNYAPLPFVPRYASGEFIYGIVEESDGSDGFRSILDLHSTYSAMNLGHNHPDIVALKSKRLEENRIGLFSRAEGMIEELAELGEKISELSGMEMIIPKNTGIEGFEVALKAARRWGCEVKGIREGKSEVIVCRKNFHGRSVAATAASTDQASRKGFGPFGPSWAFRKIPFGDAEAIKAAINKNTAAFIVEPIQAEAGVIIPPEGYLRKAKQICKENNVLFILDEVQTGLGRTGKLFAWQHDGFTEARPDGMILGKALGGGLNIASVFVGSREVLELLREGTEGSTFGGNPETCAVATKALDILSEPSLLERVSLLGEEFTEKLRAIESPFIKEVRGRGFLVVVELTPEAGGARRVWEALFQEGILAVKRGENMIGFSPPLNIHEHNLLKYAVRKIKRVLEVRHNGHNP